MSDNEDLNSGDKPQENPSGKASGGKSHIVASFIPRETDAGHTDQFRKDFLKSVKPDSHNEGLMCIYLFHDSAHAPQVEKKESETAVRQTLFDRLFGASAWEAMIDANNDTEANNDYGFPEEDLRAQEHALQKGLLSNLPAKLKLIEYGSGGYESVEKPEQFISAVLASGQHEVSNYVAVDVLGRFAVESAQRITEKFNKASFAVEGDFMISPRLNIPSNDDDKGATPVVMIYGGPIANAPFIANDKVKTPKHNATEYFAKMNKQHGIGSYVLMTYHTLRDREKLMEEYMPGNAGEEFEAFVLSGFVRAVDEGVITDSGYNPYEYWKMEADFDEKSNAVKLNAVCLKNHTINTAEGPVEVPEGRRVTQILSHKWDEKDYVEMLENAGYGDHLFFREENSNRGIVLARATRAPSPGF